MTEYPKRREWLGNSDSASMTSNARFRTQTLIGPSCTTHLSLTGAWMSLLSCGYTTNPSAFSCWEADTKMWHLLAWFYTAHKTVFRAVCICLRSCLSWLQPPKRTARFLFGSACRFKHLGHGMDFRQTAFLTIYNSEYHKEHWIRTFNNLPVFHKT